MLQEGKNLYLSRYADKNLIKASTATSRQENSKNA
jgi:hypothetical protein